MVITITIRCYQILWDFLVTKPCESGLISVICIDVHWNYFSFTKLIDLNMLIYTFTLCIWVCQNCQNLPMVCQNNFWGSTKQKNIIITAHVTRKHENELPSTIMSGAELYSPHTINFSMTFCSIGKVF